jgi:membrane-anchored protein YejM (alkaline phosphatase superfamily)
MKAAGLSDLKKELQLLIPQKLTELCLAMAKYKKDNKEYLSFLLFNASDKQAYVVEVKSELDEQFAELESGMNLYYAKKGLRKILRQVGKYSKYLGDKASSVELYIYFLRKMQKSGVPYKKSQQLLNLYEQQLKKINTLIGSLHEDLQEDYRRELEGL